MRPCAEPSHASVGAPCTTRRLDCPDAMPSATRAGRVLRGLLMHSRQSYTAVRSAPFSLHSRPLRAASEPASLPPTVVTVPRCVTIVESAGLWRTADGSLILRWREQPLAALTDGMMQSLYHAVRHLRQSRQAVARASAWAPGQRGGPAPWQQHRAQGLPDASRLPRVSAPHRVAGHVLWSNRDDACRSAQS